MAIIPRSSLRPTQSQGFSINAPEPVRDVSGAQTQELGDAVTRIGAVGMRLAADAQADADVARAKEREKLVADAIEKELNDPDAGYLNTVGKAAYDSRTDVAKRIERSVTALGNGLENDYQRELFNGAKDAHVQRALRQINDHAGRQAKVYLLGETTASIEQKAKEWGTVQGDPAAEAEAMQLLTAELGEQSELLGEGEKAAAQRRADTLGRLHAVTFGGVLEQDPARAKAYLDRYGAEMAPDARNRAAKALGEVMVRQKAQALVPELQAAGPLLRQEAEAARRLQAGTLTIDEHDETVRRLRAAEDVRHREETRVGNDLLDRAREAKQLAGEVPPALVAEMQTAGVWDKYRLWEREGDWTTPAGADVLLRTSPEDLAAMFGDESELVRAFRPLMSPNHLAQTLGLWRRGRVEAGKAAAESEKFKLPWGSDSAVLLRDGFRRVYPDVQEITDKHRAQFDRFTIAVNTALANMGIKQGDKPTDEQWTKAINTVAREKTIAGEPLDMLDARQWEEVDMLGRPVRFFDTGMPDPNDNNNTRLPLASVTPELLSAAGVALQDARRARQLGLDPAQAMTPEGRRDYARALRTAPGRGPITTGEKLRYVQSQKIRDSRENMELRSASLDALWTSYAGARSNARLSHTEIRDLVVNGLSGVWARTGMTKGDVEAWLDEKAGFRENEERGNRSGAMDTAVRGAFRTGSSRGRDPELQAEYNAQRAAEIEAKSQEAAAARAARR